MIVLKKVNFIFINNMRSTCNNKLNCNKESIKQLMKNVYLGAFF